MGCVERGYIMELSLIPGATVGKKLAIVFKVGVIVQSFGRKVRYPSYISKYGARYAKTR